MLLSQPEWADRSLEDRYAKVAEVFESMYGPIPVKSPAQPSTGKQEKPKQPDVPVSMSGVPGGAIPAVDELQAVNGMTGQELTARYERMTPEQIEAELAKL